MPRLGPPDSHLLDAAIGWLGLGLNDDAKAELKRISRAHQQHPDVLEVRWLVHANEKEWEAALEVAQKLVAKSPTHVSGWLHQAYALRRTADGSVQKAWEALRPAADKFPKEPIIPYNLSCYACQMQKLDEARDWLKRAVKLGSKQHIKTMALEDSDLKELWDEIRDL